MTVGDMPDNDLDIMSIWRDQHYQDGTVIHYADRPDKTMMEVTEHTDGTMTILVMAPDRQSEYLDGDIPDTTVNACIERAESVRLPEEDTGI